MGGWTCGAVEWEGMGSLILTLRMRACVRACVCARVRVLVLVCVRGEGTCGPAGASGAACGFTRAVIRGACRAMRVAVQVRV